MNARARRAILGKMRIAQYTDNPEEPMVACNPDDRQALIDFFDAVKEQRRERGQQAEWVFNIQMSCGNEKKFVSYDDIPFEDLPCPCGRKDHFFVKYSPNPLGLNELTHIT